jgi:phage gp36-like protein
MPYATPSQFELALGAKEAAALADPEATGSPMAGRIEYGLTLATGDINVILGDRVSAIAAAQPDFLQAACIHIARWHLSGAGTIENDPITVKHDYYTRLLRDMADGVVGNSGGESGGNSPHYGDVQIASPVNANPFSRANRR